MTRRVLSRCPGCWEWRGRGGCPGRYRSRGAGLPVRHWGLRQRLPYLCPCRDCQDRKLSQSGQSQRVGRRQKQTLGRQVDAQAGQSGQTERCRRGC